MKYSILTKVMILLSDVTPFSNEYLGWLDGIYMGEVFYAAYTQMFQSHNQSAWGGYLFRYTPNVAQVYI